MLLSAQTTSDVCAKDSSVVASGYRSGPHRRKTNLMAAQAAGLPSAQPRSLVTGQTVRVDMDVGLWRTTDLVSVTPSVPWGVSGVCHRDWILKLRCSTTRASKCQITLRITRSHFLVQNVCGAKPRCVAQSCAVLWNIGPASTKSFAPMQNPFLKWEVARHAYVKNETRHSNAIACNRELPLRITKSAKFSL